jgi:hypothetical protein
VCLSNVREYGPRVFPDIDRLGIACPVLYDGKGFLTPLAQLFWPVTNGRTVLVDATTGRVINPEIRDPVIMADVVRRALRAGP